MLPEKPWRVEAVVRLFVSVLICAVFLGAVAAVALDWFGHSARARNPRVLIGLAAAGVCFAAALILLGRTWSIERFLRRALGLLAGIYVGYFLTWWAMRADGTSAMLESSAFRIIVAVLSFQGAALVLIGRFLREQRIGWTEAFGFRNDWKRSVRSGLVTAVGIFLLVLVMHYGIQRVMERLGIESQEQIAVQVVREAGTWIDQLLLMVATVIIAPPAEEMLFRGILYPAIKQRGFPRLALWGSSVLFAAVHLNLAGFIPLTLLAVILVRLYERTGNLLAPLTAHVGFNALNFAMVLAAPWLEKEFPGLFSH